MRPSMNTQSVWTAISTPTKASGCCRTAAVTMDSAIASASRSGCPGETYAACWFMAWAIESPVTREEQLLFFAQFLHAGG
jgi:hypothetical protein